MVCDRDRQTVEPRTLLCVSLTGPPAELAAQVSRAAALGADLIELRVDLIGDADATEAVLAAPRQVPFIITIRLKEEGGSWDGSESQRVALFERLARHAPGYLDVEFAAWRRSADLRRRISALCADVCADAPGRNRLILSLHRLSRVPRDLAGVTSAFGAEPAAIGKAVFAPADATGAWRILAELSERAGTHKLALLATGRASLLTRALAPKFGACLTYAALDWSSASAPGQPTATELLECYRFRQIGKATQVFGLLGWPVAASLSPRLHNAAMRAAGIDGVYVPMPVGPSARQAAAFMNYLTQHPELGVQGLSVTSPHKEHVYRWLEQQGMPIRATARQIGAVNTLTRVGPQRWEGDNTDAAGFPEGLRVLLCGQTRIGAGRAAVLGAGGAARAVIVALCQAGYTVTVYNRTQTRAEAVASALGCAWQPWEARADTQADLVVNCTSADPEDADLIPASVLSRRPAVIDLRYSQTALIRAACAAGCLAQTGLEMLIAQAALQFQRWHGQPAPLEAMRAAVSA